MKYQQGKIKREHHTLKEFDAILKQLEKIPQIKRLIPWRISRQQKGTSDHVFSIQYETPSWWKCLMKKGGTVQELFVIGDDGWQDLVSGLF